MKDSTHYSVQVLLDWKSLINNHILVNSLFVVNENLKKNHHIQLLKKVQFLCHQLNWEEVIKHILISKIVSSDLTTIDFCALT